MTDAGWLFAAHLAATVAMTGVLWFVQLVHYPLLGHVAPAGFAVFEREGVRRTTWVVGPLMLVEAATLLALLIAPPPWLPGAVLALDLALWVAHTASTALVQVPLHAALERGFDGAAHARLVRTNWARTWAWSARAALLLVVAVAAVPR